MVSLTLIARATTNSPGGDLGLISPHARPITGLRGGHLTIVPAFVIFAILQRFLTAEPGDIRPKMILIPQSSSGPSPRVMQKVRRCSLLSVSSPQSGGLNVLVSPSSCGKVSLALKLIAGLVRRRSTTADPARQSATTDVEPRPARSP